MNKKSPTCTVPFASEIESLENYGLFDYGLEVLHIKENYAMHEVLQDGGRRQVEESH